MRADRLVSSQRAFLCCELFVVSCKLFVLNLSSVPTPRVVIDRARVKANIAAMQARANAAGVRLRPHAKTHKSPTIAKWQIEAGAVGITCAKIGEADVFADAGIADIRLAYPIQPANADRLLALMSRARLSIVVDDLEVAHAWSAAMLAARKKLDVLVKVDVGFHRCGIDPESTHAAEMVRAVSELGGLNCLGLLAHAGHAYGAKSEEEVEAIAETECGILRTLAGQLKDSGFEIREISVGSTPTARFIDRQEGVTEMRPGNYVFFDRTQVGLGAASLDDCALTVVATVVSRPVPARVIFDAGSKTLSSDGVRGFGTGTGHGLVYPSLDAAHPDPSILIERLSEEHSNARVPPTSTLRPGDRVRILPNHACVVTNLMDELLVVDGGLAVVDQLKVQARGRIW
jgi:D-serine deaminase-like pyridoxal phosphate-dependent protein